MKRYFFISYTAITRGNISTIGNCSTETNGCYFSLEKFTEDIKKEIFFDKLIVTNIIELSESDFNDLYK